MTRLRDMKLDVLRTLGKTDELMRANQINMEVSALAPALLGLAGLGYALFSVYQWLVHAAATLLPHSRHENSRAVELRWYLSTPSFISGEQAGRTATANAGREQLIHTIGYGAGLPRR